MAQSDPNHVLRKLPLLAGGLGGVLLFINRLLTEHLAASQARSDALGVILSAVLMLVGLLWQRVQARRPDAVELIGPEGMEFAPNLPETVQLELAWASHLLLTNTATRSLMLYYQGHTLLRRGILGPKATVTPGNIVKRVVETQRPIYLVDLKLYPGRVEFDYLPSNSQGLICQPCSSTGVLILAANAPRSYTHQDEQWIRGIAEKLAQTLAQALPQTLPSASPTPSLATPSTQLK